MPGSDASIYSLIRPAPAPVDPMAQYGQALQIKGLLGNQELQGLQLQQARQALAEDQATREAYSQSGGDYKKLKDLLYGKGLYKPAMAAEKAGLEATEKRGNISHKAAQTRDITAGHLAGAWAALAKGGGSDESVAQTEAMMAQLVGPEQAAAVTEKLMQMPPQTRLAYAVAQAGSHKVGQEAIKLFFPAAHMQDTGGQVQAVSTSTIPGGPAAGSVIPGTAPIVKTMTPGDKATDARGWATLAETKAEHDRAAKRGTYDADRGVVVDTRTNTATPVTMGGQPMPAKLPESSKKELAAIDAQANTIRSAISSVKANPTAFSFTRGAATMAGAVPETLAGRLDSPEERKARAFVFNVVSKVINERAGAAQSAQELARLRSFLPAEADEAQQIQDKLEGFETYLGEQRKAFAVAPQTGAAPAATPTPKTFDSLPDPKQYEGKRMRGKDGTIYKSDGKEWKRQ